MLFRFIISIGNANFWADTNPMSTAKAFPFHFKLLIGSAVVLRGRQFVVRYGAAVLEELVQYSPDYPGSCISLRLKTSALPSPRPTLQQHDRSFGGDRVRRLAPCGSESCSDFPGSTIFIVHDRNSMAYPLRGQETGGSLGKRRTRTPRRAPVAIELRSHREPSRTAGSAARLS